MSVTINGTTGISKVQDGVIQNADLADNAVSGSKIANGVITSDKIDSTSTGINLADLTVGNNQLLVDPIAGRVGIGTDSPEALLHIESNGVTSLLLEGQTRSDILLIDPDAGSDKKRRVIRSADGKLTFGLENDAINNFAQQVVINDTGGLQVTDSPTWDGSMSDTSGIGVTLNNNASVVLQRNVNSYGSETIIVNNINGSSSIAGVVQYRTLNSTRGSLNGSSSGLAISNNSDYRMKENVEEATDCLSKITNLRPVFYTHKEEYDSDTSTKRTGFIAHEIQEQFPSLVIGEKDGIDDEGNPALQSVSYSGQELITNLVGAIKEQQSIIEELTDRVAALEG